MREPDRRVIAGSGRGRRPSPPAASGPGAAEDPPGSSPVSQSAAPQRRARRARPEPSVSSGFGSRRRAGSAAASGRPSRRRPDEHARVRVDELRLEARQPVLDEERALPDLPERPAAAEVRQELGLGVRQAEQLARLREAGRAAARRSPSSRRRRAGPRRGGPRASPPRPPRGGRRAGA